MPKSADHFFYFELIVTRASGSVPVDFLYQLQFTVKRYRRKLLSQVSPTRGFNLSDLGITTCNMNAFFSFHLFMVYIPECKQQLRTMK